ncbi:ABC transporter substrate-binding protein [Anaeromyxobacter oryzae]|uniref:Branched-chain amino acid ABC transporter substrate-binding protein n=1 Tax=Anaeromyxobacter oryzae TaxID=2918170 RepID=A0ABM7X107_9BACT|nr:ABC transporter substrate-binding protein [Anaeromyxobacter oryzae]BDG05478.1 branched-chain amino acid ABC transporter substrate-binding protein [Anaeromyxobacter oryzae]
MSKTLAPLLAVLALAAPGGVHAQQKVKIGFINSITGPEAPIGEALTNGVDLALDDLKKKGIDVTLIRQDDTGKPQVAMSAFEQLASGDEVPAVVGPYSSAPANALAKFAQQYKVPLLIPVASKEEITKQGYDWVFRLCAPAHEYAQKLIDAALAFGKPKSIAFIYESTDFGTSVSSLGKAYAQQKGLKIVGDEAYQKGAPDYRSTLTKIKAANPDLVFMVSYVADAILLMRQSREVGLSPQAFLGGGAGFDTQQFQSEQQISNDVFSVTQWTPDMAPAAPDFAKRYEARFKKRPTYHAATAYESMMIMGQVVAQAGGDRTKIKQALETGSWTGIMGNVKFTDGEGFTNQNDHQMPVFQYQQGKIVTVYPPKIANGKPVYPFPGWK